MKRWYQKIGGLTLLLTLLAGCGSASPPENSETPVINPQALEGYPPLPAVGEPSPLNSANLFGLYAAPPSPATVEALSKGLTSPDGRFRAALTDQGAWAVRIDGAWYWQIELTTVTPNGQTAPQGAAGNQAVGQATQQTLGPQAGQTALAAPVQTQSSTALGGWTPAGGLLVQASTGAWFEANPLTATVTPLAPFWQGRTGLLVSPDGKQILYTQAGPKGPQVWVANRDGSRPSLVADNATAVWGPENKAVVTKLPDPTPAKPTGTPKSPTAPATGTTPTPPASGTTPPATTPPATPQPPSTTPPATKPGT